MSIFSILCQKLQVSDIDSNLKNVINAAEILVRNDMKDNDGSHDFHHVVRVVKLALEFAEAEKHPKDRWDVIVLAALLHDYKDRKYLTKDESEDTGETLLKIFFKQHKFNDDKASDIINIVKNVSYSTEISADASFLKQQRWYPELCICQDSDRNDALSAIGIARVFSFGGAKNRAILDATILPNVKMSSGEYKSQLNQDTTSVNHFFEKLLLLKDRTKTKTGRELATMRHNIMVEYLKQLSIDTNADDFFSQYLNV